MAKTPRLTSPIGVIASAMLTEAQFQAVNGASWILADGRSVAGSSYAVMTGQTSVPDLRGMVLRGKNNGRSDGNENPDGDKALGVFEQDQMQGHRHPIHSTDGSASPNQAPNNYVRTGNLNSTSGSPTSDGTNGTPRTGMETRMKNITVNFFIKINP